MWEGLGKIFAPIFAALLEAFFTYQHEKETDAQSVVLGQTQTSAVVNKESADAADRMAQANAAPHSRSDAVDRLRAGSA